MYPDETLTLTLALTVFDTLRLKSRQHLPTIAFYRVHFPRWSSTDISTYICTTRLKNAGNGLITLRIRNISKTLALHPPPPPSPSQSSGCCDQNAMTWWTLAEYQTALRSINVTIRAKYKDQLEKIVVKFLEKILGPFSQTVSFTLEAIPQSPVFISKHQLWVPVCP